MTPLEVIQQAVSDQHTAKSGKSVTLDIIGGLTHWEIEEFETRLGIGIPDEIRKLLSFTSGININSIGTIDFLGRNMFELKEVFPIGLPILGDGDGNFWVIDIDKESGKWGVVFFASHDPPAIVIQALSITEFLEQVVGMFKPPHRNLLKYISEDVVKNIRDSSVPLIDIEAARKSSDKVISSFAAELPDTFKVVDLRTAQVGAGFNIHITAAEVNIRRCIPYLVFGLDLKKQKGLLSKLFHT